MRGSTYLCLTVCFICVTTTNLIAQAAGGDSSSQQNAFNNAVGLFHTSIGEGSALYNGPEYYFYDPVIKSNAYFMDVNTFTPGSVFYNGGFYKGASMLYDLYTDEVAVLLYNHFSKFYLIKEKVKSFEYLGHHFINLPADSLKENSVIKPGYYDELYNGKLEVLVKREKTIQQGNGGPAGLENYFTTATRSLFLKKNEVYYSISSQGSLLDVLKDKKKELQQFIKSGQIKFRKDLEDAVVKIVSYYEQLTR